jgi:Kdo2-lipid IVA lauroyltransferase/acyltransferase
VRPVRPRVVRPASSEPPLILRIIAKLVALFAWSTLAPAGTAIGWLAGSVLRIRRSAVVRAMGRASLVDPGGTATAMYRGLGAGVLELLWLAGASPERRREAIEQHVTLDDDLDAVLREASARGPVILAASHTGNWELVAYGAARVLGRRGERLAVVVKPQSVGMFHAFCMQLRRTCGLSLIAPEGAFAAARRMLAAGDIVAMPIDQVPDRARHGVSVRFLGAPALADRAPAALARATGATLVVVAASREGERHRGHLLTVLRPGASATTARAWIAAATCEATRALEAFVEEHPSSWLWLHRRWRAPFERPMRTPAGSLVATGHPG